MDGAREPLPGGDRVGQLPSFEAVGPLNRKDCQLLGPKLVARVMKDLMSRGAPMEPEEVVREIMGMWGPEPMMDPAVIAARIKKMIPRIEKKLKQEVELEQRLERKGLHYGR